MAELEKLGTKYRVALKVAKVSVNACCPFPHACASSKHANQTHDDVEHP